MANSKTNKDPRIIDIKDEYIVKYSINAFLAEHDGPIMKEEQNCVTLEELFRVAHVIRSLGYGTHPSKGISTSLHSHQDVQGRLGKGVQHTFTIHFGDLIAFTHTGSTPEYAMLMCMGHYCKNLLIALKRDEKTNNKKSK